jgi:hypothetical protein
MIPVFTNPWAFLALLSIPALTGIYLLRKRFERRVVSSLMLWLGQRDIREGGIRVDRLKLPLLFFLELAILTLLALAATSPRVRAPHTSRPLVVVLDDSYSMRAGGPGSPREQALAAVRELLRGDDYHSIQLIQAGRQAQLLGGKFEQASAALEQLRQWKCSSASANLDEALALATEQGGEHGLILVVTDTKPAQVLDKGPVQWWAFGQPRPNIAFVHASRTRHEGKERCLWVVANLSLRSQRTTLIIERADEPAQRLHAVTLDLGPQQVHHEFLEVEPGTPDLRGRLGDDELEVDNVALLLPDSKPEVRVRLDIQDVMLREQVQKAVAAAQHFAAPPLPRGQGEGNADPDSSPPDLIITDSAKEAIDLSESWLFRFVVEEKAVAHQSPFIVDRTHPLTEGLSLQNVLWGGGETVELPGTPVVLAPPAPGEAAGPATAKEPRNVPLLTDTASLTGRHELRMRLHPALFASEKSLTRSTDWPSFFVNLLAWRGAHLPGLEQANVRLGSRAVLNLRAEAATVTVRPPEGPVLTLPVNGKRVEVPALALGTYTIEAPGEPAQTFAVNTLNRSESDLVLTTSGRWGDWLDEATLQRDYRGVAWILVLLAAVLLMAHLALVARSGGKGR